MYYVLDGLETAYRALPSKKTLPREPRPIDPMQVRLDLIRGDVLGSSR